MKHYLKDRPYSDYEDDVLLHEMNGAVVEEINHKFPAAFRSFLSAAVTRRVKNFLNLRHLRDIYPQLTSHPTKGHTSIVLDNSFLVLHLCLSPRCSSSSY